jgi:hypothetical protein
MNKNSGINIGVVGMGKSEDTESLKDVLKAIFNDVLETAEKSEPEIIDKEIRKLTINEIAEYNRLIAWAKQTAELHEEIETLMIKHDNRVDKLAKDREAFWGMLRKNHLLSDDSYEIDEASMTMKSKGVCNCTGCRARREKEKK